MKKKYFDNWLFYQIIPLIETNPYEAKRKFEEYLKQYPKDYTAYPFYISTLIAIKELDTAQNLLNYITDIINNDTKYRNNYNNFNRIKLFYQHIITVKTKDKNFFINSFSFQYTNKLS